MGRGDALPQRFLGALSPKTAIPRNNVLLVGAITLFGVFLLTYERGAELLNFGAFIAFMGVNAAALIHYRFRSTEKVLLPLAIPLAGLIVSAFIWLNLGRNAQVLGFVWIVLGLTLYWVRRGTRSGATAPSFDEPNL
jgi:putrescine importer